jgi:hypothetical protein
VSSSIALRSPDACPACNGWPNQAEFGPFVIDEPESHIGKKDLVHPIALLKTDELSFECTADHHHVTFPAYSPTLDVMRGVPIVRFQERSISYAHVYHPVTGVKLYSDGRDQDARQRAL